MTYRQRTIKTPATIRGIGLQTGKHATLRLKPAAPGRGIVFVRTDIPGAPEIQASPENIRESGRMLQRTILKTKRAEVQTVEHIMAALSGFCIDNITIEIDNVEIPGLDGSAKEFVAILQDTGIQEQDAPRAFIEIERPIVCSNGESFIQVLPDEQFRVEYFMDYDHPLLKDQWVDVMLDGSEASMSFFAKEIAPSRTFHVDSITRPFMLRSLAGLGRGTNYKATLVIRADGPVQNRFRFHNEPARHKLLDFLGDLYLLGHHIKGRVIAKKSGHKMNNIFVKKLHAELTQRLAQV
ncbi:MAG: UDP-3-O-acyl-N-acetylglucosamine deacetylase [Candidatus Omnitrophota bacterium]